MNSISSYFLIIILLISCENSALKSKHLNFKHWNILSDKDVKEMMLAKKHREIDAYDKADSTRMAIILNDALNIALKNISKKSYKTEYTVATDSNYIVKVEIIFSYAFAKVTPHLTIFRQGLYNTYIDVFTWNDSTYDKILSHKQWSMTYVGHKIRDINGDGIKDFEVNSYGSSGCCLKSFSDIYLLRPDFKSFSKRFEFINPTFSPKEKIIRGVCYGHPGETELYKYKWDAEGLDTLEFISFETTNEKKTGKVLITDKAPYGENYKILKRLDAVPTEYRRIFGYDWFINE